MNVHQYTAHDATGLAALIQRGEVSAAEVQQAAREAIEKVDPHLNALVHGPWEQPLAHDVAGPFRGVPFVYKDLSCHADGVPMRAGSRLLGDGIALPYDSHLMMRFREAGLAALGVTATPEFGLNASTEPVTHGPTRNPWDVSRSAGGSSGGTAALVAAGALPLGGASDGGGSIRIPAAWNGLVGLKPSRGRSPVGPDLQEAGFGSVCGLGLTRTVRDAATLLDAVAGAMPGDKYLVPPPERPWREEVDAPTGRLRIALHTGSWTGSSVDPSVAAVAEGAARRLEAAGHLVEEATPVFDSDAFARAVTIWWAAGLAPTVAALAAAKGTSAGPDTLERATLAYYERGRTMNVTELAGATATVNRLSRHVGEFFAQWDLLLTPTSAVPPQPLGYLDANGTVPDADAWTRRLFDVHPFPPLFNFTGQPAISLPLGETVDGLPIGVQLVAGMCDEATLIRAAGQLERAMPWSGRRLPAAHAAGELVEVT